LTLKGKIFLWGLLIPNFGINKGVESETRFTGTKFIGGIGKK